MTITQEEKQLLLKDLCARLAYGVKMWYKYTTWNMPWFCTSINLYNDTVSLGHKVNKIDITISISEANKILTKPYLRPMSSMTKEEKEEFENLLEGIVDGIERWDKPNLCEEYDWLNVHHFDYRGLIEKGLALEAPEGIYKFN